MHFTCKWVLLIIAGGWERLFLYGLRLAVGTVTPGHRLPRRWDRGGAVTSKDRRFLNSNIICSYMMFRTLTTKKTSQTVWAIKCKRLVVIGWQCERHSKVSAPHPVSASVCLSVNPLSPLPESSWESCVVCWGTGAASSWVADAGLLVSIGEPSSCDTPTTAGSAVSTRSGLREARKIRTKIILLNVLKQR